MVVTIDNLSDLSSSVLWPYVGPSGMSSTLDWVAVASDVGVAVKVKIDGITEGMISSGGCSWPSMC